MNLDGERLLNYLKVVRGDMANNCKRELDFIIEEIEAGTFNDYEPPEHIESRMWIFEAIAEERLYQDRKHDFPQELRLAILTEEVGEVAKELQEMNLFKVKNNLTKSKMELLKELTQVAAVCVRWIENIDKEQEKR